MNFPLSLALALVAGLLQSTAAAQLSVFGHRPDLLLVTVAAWALLHPGPEGVAAGFAGGLVADLLSGGHFGVLSAAMVSVGFVMSLTAARGLTKHAINVLPVAFLASLLYTTIILLLLQALGQPVNWPVALYGVALPSALFNAVLAPPAYLTLAWLRRWLRGAPPPGPV